MTFLYNYRLYQLITSILWTIIAIGLIFNDLYTRTSTEPLGWGYYIFVPLNNVSKTLQSILLTAYRYREPTVRKTVKNLLFFWKKKSPSNSNQEPLLRPSIELKRLNSDTSSQNDDRILNQLSQRREIDLTYTVLGTVLTSLAIALDKES